MKLLIIYIALLYTSITASELHFKFYDKSSGEQIAYSRVDLILKNNLFLKAVSKEPNDSLITIHEGKNFVYIYCNGYVRSTDTLLVTEEKIIHKDYYLEKARIESTEEIEKYHQKLDEFAKRGTLLTFFLDSVSFENEYGLFNFTFTNNSDCTIYLVKTIGCIDPVEVTLEEEFGKKLRTGALRIDCDGEKIYPNKDDLIEVPPNSKINYPVLKIFMFIRNKLKAGNYVIRAKYEYIKPEYFGGISKKDFRESRKEQIEAMIKAARGIFFSNKYILHVKN